MSVVSRRNIRSLSQQELEGWLTAAGHARYRADQILRWLYRRRVASWEEMGNLPQVLRSALSAEFDLGVPDRVREQGAFDTTKKYLWRLRDGALIESVLIPANPHQRGGASDRKTLCVSTQVGCAYGCRFCASGLAGWKRNLLPDEIVGQIVAAENLLDEALSSQGGGAGQTGGSELPRHIDNLVFMGMGEPLANYAHLLTALGILNGEWGLGIGARRITISTSGLVPEIRRLADESAQFRLAISLHGSTDEVRDQIMPINKRYPLAELTDACEYYSRKRGKMITLEYILIEGVNDDIRLTESLAGLATRLRAKVNLIPYNTVEGLEWRRPSTAQQDRFHAALVDRRVPVTLRREKGHDIDAACGQLRLREEREGDQAMSLSVGSCSSTEN